MIYSSRLASWGLCLLLMVPAAYVKAADGTTQDPAAASPQIRIGYAKDQPPFSFEQGGKPTGYVVELCQAVIDEVKAGLNKQDASIQYVSLNGDQAQEALKNGKVDLLCSVNPETLAARKAISFSLPVFEAGLGVLVRTDAPQTLLRALNGQTATEGPKWRATINRGLANHTFVVRKGEQTAAWVDKKLAMLDVQAKVVEVEDYVQGVQLVAEGKADAFFGNRQTLISYLAANKDHDNLLVLDRIFEFAPLAIGVPRGDEDLRLLVDSALSRIYRSGQIVPIYSKYFGKPGDVALAFFAMSARQ